MLCVIIQQSLTLLPPDVKRLASDNQILRSEIHKRQQVHLIWIYDIVQWLAEIKDISPFLIPGVIIVSAKCWATVSLLLAWMWDYLCWVLVAQQLVLS